MNSTDTLTTLFRHNRWANQRLLEYCAELTEEQLNASIVGTYGSIRDTLQHMTTAERSYFARISTGRPFRRPADAPPLTIAEMQESMQASGTGLIEWAPKVRVADAVAVEWHDGALREVPKSVILTQAINHATEHRAQVMATLTHLGVQPPDLDGWSFFGEADA